MNQGNEVTVSNKTVLVTGGAGYIGSHTCKALKQAGYVPVVYDNLVYGHQDFIKWGAFEKGDLLDKERIEEVIKKYSSMAVLHFAAFIYAPESVENPEKYYRNNVLGALNLLSAMKNCQIDKIIFSSTCAVYGIPVKIPISEDNPKNPINPYGQTKFIVENMLKDFDIAYGIKSIALRYFNAAGADLEGEVGENHNPESHLIPLILDVALGLSPFITIFGNDYDTPDGTCIRDYIHVTDLAGAHVLALKGLENGINSTAFNLGNGYGYSIKEIIETTKKVTGMEIKTKLAQRRKGDPPRLIADSTKAINELGWKPKYEKIEVILESAWQWHKKRHL